MQVEKKIVIRKEVVDGNETANLTLFRLGEKDGKNTKRPPLAVWRIGAHNS